ncbi:MAG TPA: glutamine-hydrolyzing GMP synthase [Thermoanaerobaculia bacterium]|nr:glutamine-hydrolyzing GMP synthase [Thermoanaerobaculia bacterium]
MSASRSIVILDFGGQYTQLIARRVRDARVFSVVLPPNAPEDEIRRWNPAGIILSGGPQSVYEADSPRPSGDLTAFGVPVLGLCYGMQWLAQAAGGKVANEGREYGRAVATLATDSPLFAGLDPEQTVWMNHGDSVVSPPPGFRGIAATATTPMAGFENRERGVWAIQFHPEVRHTVHGTEILENFLFRICRVTPDWTMEGFRHEKVAAIRKQAPSGAVICALSGGVDSSVTAILLREALGDRVHPILVDHGLMRLHEKDQVVEAFRHLGIAVHAVDASDLFLSRLAGVTDPEQKRKIIGQTFIDVFEQEARAIPDARYLAQGTLYPDVIESVSIKGPSAVIKTHHNVGGLPERLGFELIEPVRELFKDEVRLLGAELGLPREFLARHPFPGPGLAVRIPGEVTRERVAVLQKADAIVLEEIRRAGLYDAISQAFAVLLPVKTVGVMGDGRTHENVIAVRAVQTTDFMTADWFRMPHDVLDAIASRVVGSVRGVNRVVYDVTSKPPATIEWE